jgi:hypothetical protein
MPKKWTEVKEISVIALDRRIGLWDAIEETIAMNRNGLIFEVSLLLFRFSL